MTGTNKTSHEQVTKHNNARTNVCLILMLCCASYNRPICTWNRTLVIACWAPSSYISCCQLDRSFRLVGVYSLWPSDDIWQHRSISILAQLIACCLTAPSYYPNQCWTIISKAYWYECASNFTRAILASNYQIYIENHLPRFLLKISQGQMSFDTEKVPLICEWEVCVTRIWLLVT